MNKRTIGLDVGDQRIGLAVSDPEGIVSLPLKVLHRTARNQDVREIKKVMEEYQANQLVVGLPLSLSGKENIQTEKVRAFIKSLKKGIKGILVYELDERFTTVESRNTLRELDIREKDQKEVIDALAAQRILSVFLDRENARVQ